jgi:uncharacterized membrane protein HdeD (DUF308 family)
MDLNNIILVYVKLLFLNFTDKFTIYYYINKHKLGSIFMKKTITSILGIILGIIIIVFPMVGIFVASAVAGVSILLLAMFLLITGMSEIDFAPKLGLISVVVGILLFILSLLILFCPPFLGFLIGLNLYLVGIILMIVSLIILIGNRENKYGYWIGISGISLGIIYIIAGALFEDPLILGSIIGLWLIIAGVLKLSDNYRYSTY